jgi:hypothetical protein
MSKIVGASFIALGTGGIALALLKDTKYDPLIILGITKPKIISKIQQDFHCEVLFLKIATNYYATVEIEKQIADITTGYYSAQVVVSNGGYQMNDESKKRIAELQAQKDKFYKLYTDALEEYKNSICGQEMDAMECVNGGNCYKKQEFKSDCINKGIDYLTENKIITDIEADLKSLNDKDFKFNHGGTKEQVSKTLPSKKEKVAVLKKEYDSCDIANVDCASLKEDISNLKEQYEKYKADPITYKFNYAGAKRDLEFKQQIFDKTTCGSKQIVRTGVNYKDVRDCIKTDELIKAYKDDILYREKKKLELGSHWLNTSEIFLNKLKSETANQEYDFINKGCKGRLESEKLKDNAIKINAPIKPVSSAKIAKIASPIGSGK